MHSLLRQGRNFSKKNYGFDCSCIRCYPRLRVISDEQVCVENINHLPLPEVFSPQGTISNETVEDTGEQVRENTQTAEARGVKRVFNINCQVGRWDRRFLSLSLPQ